MLRYRRDHKSDQRKKPDGAPCQNNNLTHQMAPTEPRTTLRPVLTCHD